MSKRVARSSARARSCEVITTVRPSAATVVSTSSSMSEASWSRPVYGSSNSITSGSCRTARPMARRCCMPREKVRTRSRRRCSKPDHFEDFGDARFEIGDVVHARVELQVFLGGQVADRAGAGARPRPAWRGPARPRSAVDDPATLHLSQRWARERGQDAQEGGLARPVGTEQRHEFPGWTSKSNPRRTVLRPKRLTSFLTVIIGYVAIRNWRELVGAFERQCIAIAARPTNLHHSLQRCLSTLRGAFGRPHRGSCLARCRSSRAMMASMTSSEDSNSFSSSSSSSSPSSSSRAFAVAQVHPRASQDERNAQSARADQQGGVVLKRRPCRRGGPSARRTR
ncbi:MAG: hypothetical protein MZV64_19840 [Ignavibacteriales bacterium]|nr:hypothetical protein [Ignavibacteriales bacterium]